MPGDPSMNELERWQYLWKLPQAVAWEQFHLQRVVARYCLILCYAEASMVPAIHTIVQSMEDRLGMNAMSMMRLRWTVATNEVDEKRQEAATSARERFKAVEKSA